MPTIQQLPLATSVSADDEVPISQGGVARSVAVGTLLAGMQPAVMVPTGNLTGRISAGPGGPEPVEIGPGLTLNAGTLATVGIETAPQTNAIAAGDLVCINRGGTVQTITYAQFLDGQTIDAAQPARAASDSDTMWMAQGSSLMLSQTLSAIWTWITGKIPTYKLPVIEISEDTTLDGTVHNARLVICSQPITLSPAFTNMGSGFACEVLNVSNGPVTFASGILTSTGSPTLPSGQMAVIRGATYSMGSMVFAAISGGSSAGGSSVLPPGGVDSLLAGNITSNSITLSWSSPTSGGPVSAYIVQYRISGTATWGTASTSTVANSFTVNGLAPATSYDFEVFATGTGGIGTASTITAATGSTSSSSSSTASSSSSSSSSGSSSSSSNGSASSSGPSGTSVVSITWNVVPSGSYAAASGSVGVNAHINPASAPVQFGFSASAQSLPTSWTSAILVNSDLWGAYVPLPTAAGSYYIWGEGTDGSSPTVCPTPITVT
jgi:chitodextrinase